MTEDSHHPALRLVESQRTLVLATSDPDPWSTPVYYLYSCGRFYFFSNPQSRHIRAAIAHRRCAASLFRDSDSWQDIEGLQMEGTVQRLTEGKDSVRILAAYVTKYPTVKHFFNPPEFDFRRFCALFDARLFAFAPTLVFCMNNRDGFTSRRDITAIFTHPTLPEPSLQSFIDFV